MRVREKLGMIRALAYGPFAPSSSPEQTQLSLREKIRLDAPVIRKLGANTIRLYEVPDRLTLDLLHSEKLAVILTLAWSQHLTFLTDSKASRIVEEEIESQINCLYPHPAIKAILVGNEIPPEIVRWQGTNRTLRFLDRLISRVRKRLENIPLGYASFPTTEYLIPAQADFLAINVFLHEPTSLRNYIDHLSEIAHERPLLLTEIGFDSLAHGEIGQANLYQKIIPVLADSPLCGVCFFSFTDEWWRGGQQVTGWHFGITRPDRSQKPACEIVQNFFNFISLPNSTHVPFSVAICARNAEQTLARCLSSIEHLQPAPEQIILINDGSSDTTPQILRDWASKNPAQRTLLNTPGIGLSAARNLALAEAKTEYIAYCDADCELPVRWLHYLYRAFQDQPTARAAGGPNFPPRSEHPKTAALNAAPGTAGHVLLSPRNAEHIPGCNLALHVPTAQKINGFDPTFHTAGDDVDICWRILDAGHTIAYHPGAWLWHLRRSSWRGYWKQQYGYGEAETLLRFKHSHRFSLHGQARWHGTIYPVGVQSSPANAGRYGLEPYQCLYPRNLPIWMHQMLSKATQKNSLILLGFGLFTWLLSQISPSASFIAGMPLHVLPALSGLLLCAGFCFLVACIFTSARLAFSAPIHSSCLLTTRLRLTVLQLTQSWQRETGRSKTERRLFFKALASVKEKLRTLSINRENLRAIRWDADGLDRTKLLEHLRITLCNHGFIVHTPVHHGAPDLIIPTSDDYWLAIRVVTEWHQRGTTCNKIRIQIASAWKLIRRILAFLIASNILLYLTALNSLVLVTLVNSAIVLIQFHRLRVIQLLRKYLLHQFNIYKP